MERPNYIFKIPNTWQGILFKSLAKKFLNRQCYDLITRDNNHKDNVERMYLQVKRQNKWHSKVVIGVHTSDWNDDLLKERHDSWKKRGAKLKEISEYLSKQFNELHYL